MDSTVRSLANETQHTPRGRTRHSAAVEGYVRAIDQLQDGGQEVATSTLAGHLTLSASAVTSMAQRLAQLGLVCYTPYQGVRLSAAGEALALAVLRRQRLLELFLVEVLGYRWDEVQAEAESLEHVLSETLETRISAYLGEPTADPHGDPIPTLARGLAADRRTAPDRTKPPGLTSRPRVVPDSP